ncbi:unnamed protein product [Urochloa decumbens]|uniref:Uncharacterized protein n=1 Tax=Urochloa decumbens TaxID=240449 RepID=A0ABC9BTB2_9POAL
MSVLVRKLSPCVVRPSEPASMSGSTTIELSSFDKGLEKIQATALLMFEHPIHEVANTIKRALSRALVHYYPIAGRIVAGDDDGSGVHIQCNGEGVAFVSASANCALKEAMSLDRSHGARTLLDDLAIFCPAAGKGLGPADPLLMMQVTEFSCGGFVLGVTWNHAIADGAGMAQFLQAVGELANGLPSPSIVPIRWDDSLPRPPPSSPKMNLKPLDDLRWLEFTIPSRSINQIKAEFKERFPDSQPCTKFEAASGVLWQCRTRAMVCSPETPAFFMFLANVRNHVLGAKKGYYGNCTKAELIMATSGAVADGDIVDLVKMIKDSKKKIGEQFRKKEISNDPQQEVGDQMQKLAQLQYNMLIVTSWGNLAFDEIDFGSGRPARVTTLGEDKPSFPVCAVCLPWKEKHDGVNVLSAIVKEEHVDGFLGELARFT